MPYSVNKVDVWSVIVKDRPGAVAEKLDALAEAGINLEFVLARRDKKNRGVLFLAPIKGPKHVQAARASGIEKTNDIHALRVEGPDKAGFAARVTGAMAEEGINLRGLSAEVVGSRAVFYFSFDTEADAARARRTLKRTLAK